MVGPSGSGKTTFLNIVGCLDSPTGGRIVYDGTELGGLDEKAMSAYRRDRISFVFQSYNLIPVLTVRENVELPLLIERKLDAARDPPAGGGDDRRRRSLRQGEPLPARAAPAARSSAWQSPARW